MANHDPIYMMTLKTKYKTKTTCVIWILTQIFWQKTHFIKYPSPCTVLFTIIYTVKPGFIQHLSQFIHYRLENGCKIW